MFFSVLSSLLGSKPNVFGSFFELPTNRPESSSSLPTSLSAVSEAPFHDRWSNRSALEGRFRYSDLKEAAPRGSLWVLYMVEQVRMSCRVGIGGCARQLQREIVGFEAAGRGWREDGRAFWAR